MKLNNNIDNFLFTKCDYQINEIKTLIKNYNFGNLNSIKIEFNNIKKNFEDKNNQLKLICLMIYSNKLIFGFYSRDIQLFSLLFLINKPKNSGLIEQVMTGEGKSLIITFLAAYLNLVYKKKLIY